MRCAGAFPGDLLICLFICFVSTRGKRNSFPAICPPVDRHVVVVPFYYDRSAHVLSHLFVSAMCARAFACVCCASALHLHVVELPVSQVGFFLSLPLL